MARQSPAHMWVVEARFGRLLCGSTLFEDVVKIIATTNTTWQQTKRMVELLDSTGKVLKREAGFFWMRRGEQRGCVGCHAGPETSPENAAPMALLKSTTPVDMTGATAHSASGGH